MVCPHCARTIHFSISDEAVYSSRKRESDGFSVATGFCPACSKLIVLLRRGTYVDPRDIGGYPALDHVGEEIVLYPMHSVRPPLPDEIPLDIRDDYNEAASVLSLSPKASAAISRRLLQHILRERWGIKHRSLQKEIEEFVARPDVPSYVSETVDAVRVVGNFAAHPTKDHNTGTVVDVEPEEAEWLLEAIEALCDFSYVQPKLLEERKARLNAKLKAMGKPTI